MVGLIAEALIDDVEFEALMSVARSPLPKDIVAVGHDDLDAESKTWWSVVHSAMKDAKVLYEKG